jgi:hypothetical protein
MLNSEQLTEDVERARRALLGAVGGLSVAQGTFKPSGAEWSVVDVLEHLYLAELSGIAKIWAAVETATVAALTLVACFSSSSSPPKMQ